MEQIDDGVQLAEEVALQQLAAREASPPRRSPSGRRLISRQYRFSGSAPEGRCCKAETSFMKS